MVSKKRFDNEAPSPDTKITMIEKKQAAMDEKIIIILLSYLSEIDPIGHWNIAPANITPTKSIEVSKIDNFIVMAYTDKSEKIGAKINPVHIIAKLPNGEILNNSLIFIELVFLNFGGFLFVKRIGINATENNREIKIKGA